MLSKDERGAPAKRDDAASAIQCGGPIALPCILTMASALGCSDFIRVYELQFVIAEAKDDNPRPAAGCLAIANVCSEGFTITQPSRYTSPQQAGRSSLPCSSAVRCS